MPTQSARELGASCPALGASCSPPTFHFRARDKQPLLLTTAGGLRGPAPPCVRLGALPGAGQQRPGGQGEGEGRRGEGKGRPARCPRPYPAGCPPAGCAGTWRPRSARPAGTALTAAAGPASSGRPRQAGPGRARCCSRQELGGNGSVPELNKSRVCVSVCVCVPAAGAQGVVLGPSAGPAWRMKERGGWGSALPAATRADFVKR